MPCLIPIYRFDFLCVFYFIIAYFFIALFTIQLKRKDGSVGSPPIEGTRLADQSRKHPFAQLNSLSLNIYFNSHRFHAHFPLSFSGTRAPLDNPTQLSRQWRSGWQMSAVQSLAMPWADGGGPRQAQPRVRRETEINFTLGLLTNVQCAENVGTKFTQEVQSFRKVCTQCDQKQKKFTQLEQVKTLRNSLHINCQSWWKSLHRRCEICKKSLHILSKNDRKVFTEQTSVNLCKLSPKFTQACPPMLYLNCI